MTQRAINPRMAEVSEFSSLTGLRWSELRATRVSAIRDERYRALRVWRAQSDGYAEKGTKTRTSRIVPLTSRTYEIARSHASNRPPDEYLFVTASGVQLRGNGFRRTPKWPQTGLGHTIHDLRHDAASSWLRAGIPVHQVAKWLGHKNPATLLRIYAHVLGEQQEIAALRHLDALSPVRAEFARDIADATLRAAISPTTHDGISV